MSDLTERQQTIADLVRERPELFHVVCCRDENAALCGIDASALEFSDGAGEQFCVVCDDLEADGPEVCPISGRSCP